MKGEAYDGPHYTKNITGMDSRADWLLGPGLQDYLPDPESTLIPFIMNIHEEGIAELVTSLVRERNLLYVPGWYFREQQLDSNRFFTAFSSLEFFVRLGRRDGDLEPLRVASKEILLCSPMRSGQPNWWPGEAPGELAEPPFETVEWPPGTVVMGIIDDGIAFGHEHFRNACGSRVQFYWRQDGASQLVMPTVDFGRELTKIDGNGRPGIDTLLSQSTVGPQVDEELLYRMAGLIDFAEPEGRHRAGAWRAAHGTHVLDLAAGARPSCNVMDRPIVCVQLRPQDVQDTSGASWEDKIKLGIDYILNRADLMSGAGPPLPVVINFSFGTLAGPHDGTSVLERDFDQVIAARANTRLVLPAGNSHLSRCHAELSFASAGDSVELLWRVQPDDRTSSCLHVWLPHESASAPSSSRVKLTVKSPSGTETTALEENHGTGVVLINDSLEIICLATYTFEAAQTQRGLFTISLQPTARLEQGPVIPPGLWTVKIENMELTGSQLLQAWIERDDAVHGYPVRGRQSYFDHPCYVRFDAQGNEIEDDPVDACPVKRARLINAIATGKQTIVLGGVLGRELRAAKYSAGGPTTVPAGAMAVNRDGPDALCVSDDSKVHAGVLGAGSRSGSTVAFRGTSVAAPRIARAVADDLAAGNSGDRLFVKTLAQAHEAGYPSHAPPAPTPQRGGWGRIRLAHPYITVHRLVRS